MKYYDNFDYQLVDKLIQSDYRFVLYRLPNSNVLQLILQETKENFTFQDYREINDNGFVIAPFKVSDQYPIIQIKPEVVINGEREIFDYLNRLSYQSNQKLDQSIVENETTKDTYNAIFDKFHSTLLDNIFQKIVLSKLHIEDRKPSFVIGKCFKEACIKYPNSYVYVFHTPISNTWLGATPELLLSRSNDVWNTVALAGTRAISERGINWDQKNKQEQAIVAEYLDDLLQRLNCKIRKNDVHTLAVGGLEHLKTEFSFQNLTPVSLGVLLGALHPTPAICGLPKSDAYDFIINNEKHNRRYYSGFLGNISDREANFFVNLRCMNILQDRILLFAGSGILSSSDMESEWDETEMKLDTMLSIINKNKCTQ